MEVALIRIRFRSCSCPGTIQQAVDALSRVPTGNADDSPLGDDVSTIQTSSEAELDSAYVYSCIASEEERLLKLALLPVAALMKTPSYAQPLKLKNS